MADILNYTIRLYNSSGDQWTNWTVGPSVNAVSVIKDANAVPGECTELFFNISATNVVGESRVIPVSGGFPIGEQFVTKCMYCMGDACQF